MHDDFKVTETQNSDSVIVLRVDGQLNARSTPVLVEKTKHIQRGHFKEFTCVHETSSSPVDRSLSLTSARLKADLIVPSGMSSSVPICLSVCPLRYARFTTVF